MEQKTKTMKKIEDVKQGEFVRRKEGAKTFIRGKYMREIKRYELTAFDDINKVIYLKKGTIVHVDFEF